jgi:hypothetical protein
MIGVVYVHMNIESSRKVIVIGEGIEFSEHEHGDAVYWLDYHVAAWTNH